MCDAYRQRQPEGADRYVFVGAQSALSGQTLPYQPTSRSRDLELELTRFGGHLFTSAAAVGTPVRQSMGSVGDAYDNAKCESLFATLECELLARHRFASQTQARMTVFSYIEGWYNTARRHAGIGYLSPTAYEKPMLTETGMT
jgi:transposase InsO family protein